MQLEFPFSLRSFPLNFIGIIKIQAPNFNIKRSYQMKYPLCITYYVTDAMYQDLHLKKQQQEIIMSGQVIEYTIQKKKDFVFLQGNMDTLYQKNSDGFMVDHIPDQFEMSIKLKSPSIVYVIQAYLIQANFITIQLYDKQNQLIERVLQKTKKMFEATLLVCEQSKKTKKITSRIKIILSNIQNQGEISLGLKYLLVKGEKHESKLKKDISKKPQGYSFGDAKQSPHAVKIMVKDSNTVFSERKKNKELTQDEQLKKAMQESRKLAEKQGDIPYFKEEESNKMKVQHYEIKEEKNYPLIDFDKVKDCLNYVNSTWLDAQRKIQVQKGIKEQHRLSNQIQVKHFHNKTICVDITPEAKKKQIEKIAEQLGAKILKEVTDNCILISTRADTQKVARARKLKNVKILSPKFVEECKQCDAYLNERDYFLKL